jgi:hypothetical protein
MSPTSPPAHLSSFFSNPAGASHSPLVCLPGPRLLPLLNPHFRHEHPEALRGLGGGGPLLGVGLAAVPSQGDDVSPEVGREGGRVLQALAGGDVRGEVLKKRRGAG